MKATEVRREYRNNVLRASFKADGCSIHGADGPRVLVYPYRVGGPYLWVFMEGNILEEGETAIKDGGREDGYREAVASAVARLMDRVSPQS
jgi:hypothetical protein